MLVLAGIFFNVQFRDADLFLLPIDFNFNPTVSAKWFFTLRNLVSFGVIRIEVVFTVKMRLPSDICMQR